MKKIMKLLATYVLPVFCVADGDGGGGTTGAAGALSGDGGATSGTPASGSGTPASGSGTPAPTVWYDTFKDTEVRDWIRAQNNGIPDPEALGRKALNLEKFIGADKAGRGVIVPKPDAPKEEWQAFYKKVGGIPEKPEGYILPKDFDPAITKAITDDPMFAKFQAHAHKIGMPAQFFGEVMAWFAAESKAAHEGKDAELLQNTEREVAALKGEWGKEWDKNVEMGRRAAKAFIPHKDAGELESTLTRIEGALGTAQTFKLWASIGAAMGEDTFIQGAGTGGMGGMTPEAARIRINELKKDQQWIAAFTAGDSDKRSEWDRLHKLGYGEKAA